MAEQLIYKKICDIQAEIDPIGKGERNKQQGYNFRGIDTVYNELHNIFVKHRVFSTTEILEDKHEERQSKSGGTLIYRILKIKYTFYAEDGSNVSSIVMGEGMDSGDKASNKAMAIGHKYALLQLLTIPTQEQKDPDYDTHEVENKKEENLSEQDLTEKKKISPDQAIELDTIINDKGYTFKELMPSINKKCNALYFNLDDITVDKYEFVKSGLEKLKAKK